ncbi:MAG: ATP-binding protein [Anaerolineae bacterium]
MSQLHQLTTPLKQLRLSGILETLEARNLAAIDGHWSYIEFLERLLEDEVERRAQKQLGLRLRRAPLNTTKTLETFGLASTRASTVRRSCSWPVATTSAASATY